MEGRREGERSNPSSSSGGGRNIESRGKEEGIGRFYLSLHPPPLLTS